MPAVETKFNLAYDVPDRRLIGLSNAFDDGTRTFLQFGPYFSGPLRVDNGIDGHLVPFIRDGNYWVAKGIYEVMVVKVGAVNAIVTDRRKKILASEGSRVNESLAVMRPLPVATKPATEALAKPMPKSPPASLKRVLQFKNAQDTLDAASQRTINEMVVVARDAVQIRIMGFTGTVQPTAASKALAIRRADAVRQALLREGVDASRMRVFYQSFCCAGRDVTDSLRSANQRAEVLMLMR